MFRRVDNTQQSSMVESGYFCDSPPIYHYGNNPLYFARFNYQSSSGELPSYSEASDNHAPQFASLVRSDSPGLDRRQATPSPVESSSSDNGAKKCWKREDTLALIEQYRNRKDDFRDPKKKNKRVWEQIAEAMRSDGGSSFGAKECETEFKNLKRSYTVCVDHNKISGNKPKKCSFFEEL